MSQSSLDLETALRRIANHKATGPDQIPGEFCNSNPAAVGRQMYSQLLKLILHGQEALGHKHGRLTTLWKGKGPHRDASSYRSILISSHVGKALHRTLRVHQSDLYEAFLQAQQVGGRRKVPVTIGLHMVRSFIRWQKQQHRSSSVIFLDLKEAFYRIVRPLVVDTPMTDEALATMAARLGLSSSTLHDLHALLRHDNASQSAHLPWHAQKYLTALHTDTNFSFAGQTDVCRTAIGTRPGDAFADVVFGYAWARVLASLEKTMGEQNLTESVPSLTDFYPYGDQLESAEATAFLGPSWMDDLAICLSATTATALEHKTAHTTGILLDLCQKHGMTPNIQKGKTEILFSFRGKGSRSLRLRYHSASHGRTLPVVCEDGVFAISVVGDYLHLGATCHHSTQSFSELKRRIAIGHQAFTKHRKLLYHNSMISFDKRRQFFETLVLSKIMYGTEIWILKTKAMSSYFHSAILRLYRRLLRTPHDAHVADHEILAETGLPSPEDLLRRQRLRYLGTLCQCSTLVPWGLFRADASWHALLLADLDWMYAQLRNSSSLPDPRVTFWPWKQLLVEYPRYWKRLVTRATLHSSRQRARQLFVQLLHRDVIDALVHYDLVSPPPAQEDSTPAHFGCLKCGLRFKSKGGEGAHMNRKHGYVAKERFLFDGTSCPACLKQYHSHCRVQAHLRYSTACRDRLRGQRLRCTPVAGQGSQANNLLAAQHNGLLPVQVSDGVQLPVVPGPAEDFSNDELWDVISAVLLEGPNDDLATLVTALRDRIPEVAVSWTQFCITLTAFQRDFHPDDAEMCGCSPLLLAQAFAELRQPDLWPCFVEVQASSSLLVALRDYEAQCYDVVVQDTKEESIPWQFGRERILLHAYAGRRRPGDFQFFLDIMAAKYPDMIIYTVSLDLVIDEQWGDVMDASTRAFWLDHAKQGHVLGFIAGPPCNTWSVARETDLGSDRPGPRVVRSAQELWGFQALTIKELLAVHVGNVLLGFALLMLLGWT